MFAPTESFAVLPAGRIDGLLAQPALKKVLLYHDARGPSHPIRSFGLTSADFVEGSPIAISGRTNVYLNDSSKVVTMT